MGETWCSLHRRKGFQAECNRHHAHPWRGRNRYHWAALRPQGTGIMLELMRFPEELLSVSQFKAPNRHSGPQGHGSLIRRK
jgi:hypothetical protein